jgi:glyoxylase-like metal-dependent hydrolase (beta-lactamase superfamily II)
MWRRPRQIGRFAVTSLTDGCFALDGGAMFGTVPKTVWEPLTGSDAQNRIPLRINPLLLEVDGLRILVETGFHDGGDRSWQERFAVRREETLLGGLAELGIAPADIDLIVHTHLHFDHAGGNTQAGQRRFPKARHLVQRQELYDANHPHERSRASYLQEDLEPVERAGAFELLDGEAEILPGLRVVPLPGHTLGQQGVFLESEGQQLVYVADLLPTAAHAHLPYIMGYDLYPVTTLEVRRRWFADWLEQGALLALPHDPEVAFAQLELDPKGRYRLRREG